MTSPQLSSSFQNGTGMSHNTRSRMGLPHQARRGKLSPLTRLPKALSRTASPLIGVIKGDCSSATYKEPESGHVWARSDSRTPNVGSMSWTMPNREGMRSPLRASLMVTRSTYTGFSRSGSFGRHTALKRSSGNTSTYNTSHGFGVIGLDTIRSTYAGSRLLACDAGALR